MMNVAKKKAQISGGIGNLSDAAIMFLAKAKEEKKRLDEENERINLASILSSQKEMKSFNSKQSENPLAEQVEPIGNLVSGIDNKIVNTETVNQEINRD